MLRLRLLPALAAAVFFVHGLCGAIVQVLTPDPAYRDATTLLPITEADDVEVDSLADDVVEVALGPEPFFAGTVGTTWNTWGNPPSTEGATPRVLYGGNQTTVTFDFSTPLTAFGLEAEPRIFNTFSFTMSFYSGAELVGQIVRAINGNSGARLLAAYAAEGDTFTSVTLTSIEEFAVARVRYAVPEPSAGAVLLAAACCAVTAFARFRRSSPVSQTPIPGR